METFHSSPKTISETMQEYLDVVKFARSKHTMLAYRNSLNVFRAVLKENSLDPDSTPIENLTEDMVASMADRLKPFSPATEQLYLQAVKGFYEFVASKRLADVNFPRIRAILRLRARRPGKRIPQFPMDEIERLLSRIEDVGNLLAPIKDDEPTNVKLRAYRDRAFLYTLADTGFRVHEACKLRRGDINWNEQYAIIIGKGDKQAVVRFTSRSLQAIKEYLSQRAELDGNSGKQLSALPLFARHDKGAGKRVKPMTTATGRNIVRERVNQFLGREMVGKITPHSFRHYFVTSVLRGTGNLKITQELARHENIQVTERYAHLSNEELDKAYHEVFERKPKT